MTEDRSSFVEVPWPHRPAVPADPLEGAESFLGIMRSRRSVRAFRPDPVPRAVIERLVEAAASAPSGANKQPWRFVCVSDPATKHAIRLAAEEEERSFYERRASDEWLADLRPLGTDPDKAFLETAPWLIVMFRLTRADDGGGVYYAQESCGIAAGFLLAAIHHAGLATLTHTPSPMAFLQRVLKRPLHEKPYLLLPVGYPAEALRVPEAATTRRPLAASAVFVEPDGVEPPADGG
jgi:iodotyrosine deiodinase